MTLPMGGDAEGGWRGSFRETPFQPLLCPGCYDCLGGGDDLIRERQLSQTSEIASSVEKHLGSPDADILGTLAFVASSNSVYVAGHVTPKSHWKFIELQCPLGLLIIWVGKLSRHLSF